MLAGTYKPVCSNPKTPGALALIGWRAGRFCVPAHAARMTQAPLWYLCGELTSGTLLAAETLPELLESFLPGYYRRSQAGRLALRREIAADLTGVIAIDPVTAGTLIAGLTQIGLIECCGRLDA
jgi:hypothetical protein